MSAIDRDRAIAERRLHVEPADMQLEGKAAVTECPPSRLPQKVADRPARVVYQDTVTVPELKRLHRNNL